MSMSHRLRYYSGTSDLPPIRLPYNTAVRLPTVFNAPSRTKQSFSAETDINTIMARYERTGLLEHARSDPPQYGDFSEVTDYQSAVNQVMAAEQAFSELPARVRKEFDNDPGAFLDWVQDPARTTDELVELGLAAPPSSSPAEPKATEPAEPATHSSEPAKPAKSDNSGSDA